MIWIPNLSAARCRMRIFILNKKRLGFWILWLCVWQAAAVVVDNRIVMASPLDVGRYLLAHSKDPVFYHSIGHSTFRILAGFLAALVAGIVLAVLAYRFALAGECLMPLMAVVKATPVAAVTVLLLLWAGTKQLSVVLCFLIVLPNVYEQMRSGLLHLDAGLLNLADCYRLPFYRRLLTIYKSETASGLYGCMKACVGLAFKSAVAAEVIAIPRETMGERLYFAKIHLDTPGVFAWTAVVVLLSWLTEKAVLFLFDRYMAWSPDGIRRGKSLRRISKAADGAEGQERIDTGGRKERKIQLCLQDTLKVYSQKPVFAPLSRTIRGGECHVIIGPSGIGKTTLLHMIAGLLLPDAGELSAVIVQDGKMERTKPKIGMVFQDEVILPSYTAQQNIEIFAGRRLTPEEMEDLDLLLSGSCLGQKAGEMSGGMKRRVQIARALLSPALLLIMDEPFRGLDPETKKRCIQFIQKYRMGRTLIVSTHDERDVEYLGGILWKLE